MGHVWGLTDTCGDQVQCHRKSEQKCGTELEISADVLGAVVQMLLGASGAWE